jgi:uncharacterized membrane protein
VCGADTFLFYHGIDTTERKIHVQQMYEDPAASLPLYDQYSVDYIVVSSWECGSYTVDKAALQKLFTPVFQTGNVVLYKVN